MELKRNLSLATYLSARKMLINALRFLFACRELLDNLATHKHWQDADWSFILRSLNCFFTISRLLVFKGYNDPISVFCRGFRPQWRLVSDSWMCFISFQVWPMRCWLCQTPVDMCSYASMDFSFLVRCFLPPCELSDSSQNESPSSQYGENFFTFTRLVPESCHATSVGGKRSNHFLIADQSSFWRWDSIKRLLVARTFNRVV